MQVLRSIETRVACAGYDPRVDPFEPGASFGHYRISRHVARGGMADVYEATCQKGKVALKVPLSEPLCAERLPLEASNLGRVRANGVPRLIAVELAPPHLVMEWLEGIALPQLMLGLAIERIVEVGSQLIDVLARMHRAGVIHRDIKCDNVLIGTSQAYLVDFGVSWSEGQPAGSRQGALVSWAPERLSGADGCDPRSDIYSLALVLFQMLAWDDPFDFDHPDWQRRMLEDAPPSLCAFRPEAERFDAFFSRMLDKDPAQRPEISSMRELWLRCAG